MHSSIDLIRVDAVCVFVFDCKITNSLRNQQIFVANLVCFNILAKFYLILWYIRNFISQLVSLTIFTNTKWMKNNIIVNIK